MGAGRDAKRKAEKFEKGNLVMKWNDDIRGKVNDGVIVYEEHIYDSRMARDLSNGNNGKALSLKKQENIRMAIKGNVNFIIIGNCVRTYCGLCFEVRTNCDNCMCIVEGVNCVGIEEFSIMNNADGHKVFADAHKAWCKKIGLWLDHWE